MVGRVHVVERHREAALGLAAQPGAADALDLAPLLDRQLARAHHARRVPGLVQARDRLAHLADRPALEREARRVHDGLVAHVDRAQADRVPVGEVRLGDAERRHAPGVGVAVAREVGQQGGRGRGVSDGIAGHERHAADGSVGEEARALLVEEVRLVAAQREVGQRVAPVALDEAARVAAVGRVLADGAVARAQCEPDDVGGADRGGAREADRQPVLEAAGVAARVDAHEAERDAAEGVVERERHPAHLGVHVGRDEPVDVEPGESPEGGRQRPRRAVRIAGRVEVVALPPEQRERHRAGHRIDDVALLEQMPDAGDREQPERRLPGAVTAPREPAPEQDEAERGGHDHAVGDVRRGRAEQLGDERQTPGPGRRDHGDEPGEARGGGHEREQEGGARSGARSCWQNSP